MKKILIAIFVLMSTSAIALDHGPKSFKFLPHIGAEEALGFVDRIDGSKIDYNGTTQSCSVCSLYFNYIGKINLKIGKQSYFATGIRLLGGSDWSTATGFKLRLINAQFPKAKLVFVYTSEKGGQINLMELIYDARKTFPTALISKY